MPSFVVKHVIDELGPLSSIMSEVKVTPHSYTSKKHQATSAAKGNYIYVIEVNRKGGKTSYKLGYKYRAHESFTLTGSSMWKGQFKFKNSAVPGEPAEGKYFEEPILIDNEEVRDWLSDQTLGMVEIPQSLVGILDAMFSDKGAGARAFA